MSLLFVHVHVGEKKMNVCYFMKTTPFCMINILKMIFRYTITQIPHILVLTVHRIIIKVHIYSFVFWYIYLPYFQ